MSRRVIAGVNEFNQDPELRGKLVNSLKQEKIYQKRAPRPKTGLTNLEIAILIVIIVFLFGLLMGLAVPLSVYVVTVPGGNTTEVAQTAFVDQRGLSQFINVLNVLTAECQPPAGSPALAMATVGKSRAQSTAAWQAIMAAVQGNPLNGTGCQFYGLLGAEARVSQQMGPADICQAYINIGIDLLHALYGFHMPTNISSILNAAFEIAYPLNIFWLNTNTPIVNQQQVVARLYAIVVCLTQPGTQCTARPIDVQGIATQFCNPFFASDDLTYYGQAFMPWLKFPFPGLLPRNGENTDAPQVRRLVSPQTIASLVANGTFLPGANATVVAVYVLGDVLATEPSMALTLDTVFGGVPRYYPSFETVPEFLDQVANHLQALDRGETIVVVARYAREFNLFNSVNFVAAAAIAFPPPLFFLFSNAVVPGDRFVATPTNLGLVTLEIQNFATSAQIINVVDVLINLTNFDGNYTREYVHEKRVATFVQNAINPFAVLGMTATLQLLDTFALKNVLVYGVDLGGHVDGAVQNFVLDRAGYFPGYRPLPLLVEAQIQTVTTPAVDRHDRRRSAPYPASLDYRTASQRNCLRPVFAQGECGGSWASTLVAAQSSRFCMRGVTHGLVNLSLTHIAACASIPGITNGCEPGHPAVAATFMSTLGTVDESCFPSLTTVPCDFAPCAPPPCLVNCPGAGVHQVYGDTSHSPIFYKIDGVEALKSELYHNGPLVACYNVPVDFYAFFAANASGCYANDTALTSGNSDCAIVVGYSGSLLYLRSVVGPRFASGGDFCVNMSLTRGQGGAWFYNEAWAAQTGNIRAQYSATVPIPAGTDRTPSLIIDPPTTILAVEPLPRR